MSNEHNRNDASWDDFRLLLALERAGSVTAAARVLDTHAATVTRRLQGIERRLGRRLFDRAARPMRVDANLRALVEAAEAMERAAQGGLRAAAETDGMTGPLTIGLPDASVARLVTPTLCAFLGAHPGIAADLRTYPTTLDADRMATDLRRRLLDVAVVVSEAPPDWLSGRRVMVPDYGWVAAPGVAADAPVIGWSHPSDDAGYFPEAADTARVGLRVDTMLTMLEAAVGGAGHAWLPLMLADTTAGLARLPGPTRPGPPVWVLCHPHAKNSARVRAAMTALVEAAA